MRTRLLFTLVGLGVVLSAGRAAAQAYPPDGIYLRPNPDKPAYKDFEITSESPRGLVLKGGKAEIPAEKVEDIVFPLKPREIHIGAYRLALIAEKNLRTAKKEPDRVRERTEALSKFQETLGKLAEGQPYVKAHLEYKIASLLAQQGREKGKEAALKQAAAKFKDFKKDHPKAWQLVRVLQALAQLQLDFKDYEAAEQTYRELAKSDAAPDVRQDAEVQALLVTVQAGKHAEARSGLEALIGKLPDKSPQQLRARLALAECLGYAKDPKDLARAQKEVKAVLDQTKDKALRALAYNTMGHCYHLNEQWQDARWEFLWVDVIYNQDPQQHAKALYYLSDIFARLGEGERARECREVLLGPRYSSSEYQRRALKEEKSQ
jgi:tetratricopeptide (TPR) repeat protein